MTNPDHDIEMLRLVNAEMQARIDRLSESSSKLDSKATTLLGFAIALGAFVLTQETLGWWRLVPLVLLSATCYFAWRTLGVRQYKEAPEPSGLLNEIVRPRFSETTALALILRAKEIVFTKNHKLHETKAKAWHHCLIALTFSAAVSIGLLLWGGPTDVKRGPESTTGAHEDRGRNCSGLDWHRE